MRLLDLEQLQMETHTASTALQQKEADKAALQAARRQAVQVRMQGSRVLGGCVFFRRDLLPDSWCFRALSIALLWHGCLCLAGTCSSCMLCPPGDAGGASTQ